MPESKWDDAEESTINNFCKIGILQLILYMLLTYKCAVIDRSITYQPKLTVILLKHDSSGC